MSDQNNRSSGFNLGLIFGLLVGFLIAILIYKKNPKAFANLADKLNSLIKDISSDSVKKAPPAVSRPRRPKTFVRS